MSIITSQADKKTRRNLLMLAKYLERKVRSDQYCISHTCMDARGECFYYLDSLPPAGEVGVVANALGHLAMSRMDAFVPNSLYCTWQAYAIEKFPTLGYDTAYWLFYLAVREEDFINPRYAAGKARALLNMGVWTQDNLARLREDETEAEVRTCMGASFIEIQNKRLWRLGATISNVKKKRVKKEAEVNKPTQPAPRKGLRALLSSFVGR